MLSSKAKDRNKIFFFGTNVVSKAHADAFGRNISHKGWMLPIGPAKISENKMSFWPGFRLKPAPYQNDNF